MPIDACCPTMQDQLDHECPVHADRLSCPDVVVLRMPNGQHLIPIRDGGTGALPIRHCPWCGEPLALY